MARARDRAIPFRAPGGEMLFMNLAFAWGTGSNRMLEAIPFFICRPGPDIPYASALERPIHV